jgi:hypothetical protein
MKLKLYVVIVAMNAIDVNGVETKLPKGHWFLPVFEDQEEAIKFADGRQVMLAEQEVPDGKRTRKDKAL